MGECWSSVALAAVFLSSSPGERLQTSSGGIKGEAFVTRSVMNTPLKARSAGPGAGRLQSHRKWRRTQENGVRRDRSHAHGTAARRAPMWAAGPPGCVGKRSAQRPQGAKASGMEARRGETKGLAAQHDSPARPQGGRRTFDPTQTACHQRLRFTRPLCVPVSLRRE